MWNPNRRRRQFLQELWREDSQAWSSGTEAATSRHGTDDCPESRLLRAAHKTRSTFRIALSTDAELAAARKS
jgi:hypothetical protein